MDMSECVWGTEQRMARTYLEDGAGPVVSPSLPIRGPVLAGRFHPEGVLRPLLSDIVVGVRRKVYRTRSR